MFFAERVRVFFLPPRDYVCMSAWRMDGGMEWDAADDRRSLLPWATSDRCNVFASEVCFGMTWFKTRTDKKKKLSAHWIYNIFAWMTACCILGLSLRLLPCSLPSTSSRIKHFLYLPTMIQWANIFIIPHESLKDCFLRKKVAEFVCSLYFASLTQLWWVYERAQWKTRRLWLVLDTLPPWLSDRGSTGCTHQDSARSGTTKDTDENGGPEFSGLHQIPSTL